MKFGTPSGLSIYNYVNLKYSAAKSRTYLKTKRITMFSHLLTFCILSQSETILATPLLFLNNNVYLFYLKDIKNNKETLFPMVFSYPNLEPENVYEHL